MGSLLRDRNFLLLLISRLISQLGDRTRDMVILFWVFRQDPSPLVRTISVVAEFGPVLLLAPLAGVYADRWSRKYTLVGADLLRFGVSLGQLIAVARGDIWLCLGLTAVSAGISQFAYPAGTALLPEILGNDRLAAGSGLSQAVSNLTMLVGPCLGTLIYMTLGARGSFTVDALSFLISGLMTLLLTISGAPAVREVASGLTGVVADFTAGLRYAFTTRMTRNAIIVLIVLFLGGGAANTLNIYFFRDILVGDDYEAVVTVITMLGAGAMLAGSLAFSALGKRIQLERVTGWGVLLCALGLGLPPLLPSLPMAYIMSVVLGFGNAGLNAGLMALMMRQVEPSMRGRFFGLFQPLMVIAMLLSAGVGSWAYGLVGVQPVLVAAAGFIALAGLLAVPGLRPETAAPEGAAAV